MNFKQEKNAKFVENLTRVKFFRSIDLKKYPLVIWVSQFCLPIWASYCICHTSGNWTHLGLTSLVKFRLVSTRRNLKKMEKDVDIANSRDTDLWSTNSINIKQIMPVGGNCVQRIWFTLPNTVYCTGLNKDLSIVIVITHFITHLKSIKKIFCYLPVQRMKQWKVGVSI